MCSLYEGKMATPWALITPTLPRTCFAASFMGGRGGGGSGMGPRMGPSPACLGPASAGACCSGGGDGFRGFTRREGEVRVKDSESDSRLMPLSLRLRACARMWLGPLART